MRCNYCFFFLLLSTTIFSQSNFNKLTKKEIYNSIERLSIYIHNPKSDVGVFFNYDFEVENLDFDPCEDISTNKNLNKKILRVIEKFNLLDDIQVEGEDGIISLKTGQKAFNDKNVLTIYIYYDAKQTTGSCYLAVKEKTDARKFLDDLIFSIGENKCLRKLK